MFDRTDEPSTVFGILTATASVATFVEKLTSALFEKMVTVKAAPGLPFNEIPFVPTRRSERPLNGVTAR